MPNRMIQNIASEGGYTFQHVSQWKDAGLLTDAETYALLDAIASCQVVDAKDGHAMAGPVDRREAEALVAFYARHGRETRIERI